MSADNIFDMVEALDIPARIVTPTCSVFTGVEGFSLLCARFRTAGDMYNLVMQYDRAQSAISEVINQLVYDLDEKWEHLLDCNQGHLLHPHNLICYANAIHNQDASTHSVFSFFGCICYADAIHDQGAPIHSVFGFIDCTIRQICRSTFWQRQCYAYVHASLMF